MLSLYWEIGNSILEKHYQSDLAKSKVKVEYAMRGLDKPLGVATYQLEQLVKDNIDEVID